MDNRSLKGSLDPNKKDIHVHFQALFTAKIALYLAVSTSLVLCLSAYSAVLRGVMSAPAVLM